MSQMQTSLTLGQTAATAAPPARLARRQVPLLLAKMMPVSCEPCAPKLPAMHLCLH